MRITPLRLLATALAALALLGAGCGSDDDGDDEDAAAGPGETATVSVQTAPTATATEPVEAGASAFERGLGKRIEGTVNCGDQQVPPPEGKTVSCDASATEEGGVKRSGPIKITAEAGGTVRYEATLTSPEGGASVKLGTYQPEG